MSKYKIDYEILTLEKLQKRLEKIISNPENKFKVTKLENIGYTTCGFPIEHYSIGNGPFHVTYMGGAHGNEIISVDFVTQLMQNLALGNNFDNFDPEIFTIDFIPVQNPEGFAVTTYALDSVMKNMTEEEIEKFSKTYWTVFREDDQNVLKIDKLLKTISEEFNTFVDTNSFWINFQNKVITRNSVYDYLIQEYHFNNSKLYLVISNVLKDTLFIERKHTNFFNSVTPECIPEITKAHQTLKSKIINMYRNNLFPNGSLANFYSNSNGVNLNDNNPIYYKIMKEQISKYGKTLGNMRDNHITKSIKGPIGMANYDMSEEFRFEPENTALLNYLHKLESKGENIAFFNCHGTGGLLYTYPIFIYDYNTKENEIRDFTFYINNRIATEYTKAIGEIYQKETGKYDTYKMMGHPERITGVGDLLRQKYIASFMLELSKMGGNPISPYGDKNGNFYLTMTSNFNAFNKTLETILSIKHLYKSSYIMTYDEFGMVHYEESSRSR